MRQAGRYLPEYRALRAKVDFETLTRTPELAAEVTLQPLRRFELDAAILFSDIMTPLQGMGVELDFEPGPCVREPIRTDAQIDALPALVPERDVPFVLETIRLVRAGVPRGVPLIGFAGAPFTLLCYLVCGRPSKEFAPGAHLPVRAARRPPQRLLAHLADAMAAYLAAQARGRCAGAHAVRVVGGAAGAARVHALRAAGGARAPSTALRRARRATHLLREPGLGAHGGRGRTSTWTSSASTGARALHEVRRILGPGKAVQGNLDPAALFAPPAGAASATWTRCSTEAGDAPGHIFNLGHGIWPDTDPDAVARLVDYVHERR